MQFTKISSDVQRDIHSLLNKYPTVMSLVNDIVQHKGCSFLVGGAVRDLFFGLPIKDLDIEVYGLSPQELEKLLSKYGYVDLVGKVFGVFRVQNLDVDWSLPRIDMAGRKPEVIIDPSMNIEQALRRRDLTINAMAIDLSNYALIDPFEGLNDMRNKILRTPDSAFFIEDPLRFYRVMQFIGRFEMYPDEQLNELCKKMDISKVSVERIDEEFRKLMLKSNNPSLGIRWFKSISRLNDILPELAALVNVPQASRWHPEYDAFEHTMQTIDAAARLKYDSDDTKFIVLLAALCHDLGKTTTTEQIEGEWHSFGHSKEGVEPTKQLLKRITRNKELIETVVKMVRYHMQPIQFVESGAKPSAYKRLAAKLAPQVTLAMLAKLSLADQQGRNPQGHEPLDKIDKRIDIFLQNAEQAQVLHETEKPILSGRDLLDVVKPGPNMGKLLKKAYELQIEEGIKDKQELKRRVLSKQ
jgi:tRNA nucleotidyltransferase (CCA-adding enzyme)